MQPNQAIFDLDPGDTVSFTDIREAALRLHDQLEQAGIRGYPKTSGGGGGLHAYVPLASGYTFERIRSWVKAVGQQLASTYPILELDELWSLCSKKRTTAGFGERCAVRDGRW